MANKAPAPLMTPLQVYAVQAHELYMSFQEAGFTAEEAWSLMTGHLPDFEIPIAFEFDGRELLDYEGEENGSEEEDDC